MTSRPWSMTRRAARRLVEIGHWTRENFGTRQADAYEEDLLDEIKALASGIATSRDCRRLIRADLPVNLRFSRKGQHYIFFLDAPSHLTIVELLHVRSDLSARLSELVDDRDQR